jgi:hypothetical protein
MYFLYFLSPKAYGFLIRTLKLRKKSRPFYHCVNEHVWRPRNVWRLVVLSIFCRWLVLVASNFENKSLKEPSETEVNIIRKLDSFVSVNRFVGVYKMQPLTQQCLRILKNKPLFVIVILCRWVVSAHYIIRLKNVLEGIQTS